MDDIETATFLTTAKLTDARLSLDQELARVDRWQELLDGISFTEAMDALVVHQRESTQVPLPAHIVALVQVARARAERPERRKLQLAQMAADAAVPPLTAEMKAEADRVFRESLAEARAARGQVHG